MSRIYNKLILLTLIILSSKIIMADDRDIQSNHQVANNFS